MLERCFLSHPGLTIHFQWLAEKAERPFPHEETRVRFSERNLAVVRRHQGKLRVAVLTRRGSGRTINQDRVVVDDTVVDSDQPTTAMFNVEPPSLIAVLDGLGAHPAGDIASAVAGEVIAQGSPEVETEQDVMSLVEGANQFLYNAMLVHKGLRNMGTTIAGVLVTTDTAVVFWVGDSRVYLEPSGDDLTQLTVDDWDSGYITQTLGGYPWFHPIQVHTATIPLSEGRILAATDGLFGRTNPARLSEAMNGPLEAVPDQLSELAKSSGNTDDCSIAVIELAGPDRQQPLDSTRSDS